MNETTLTYNRGVYNILNGVLQKGLRDVYNMEDRNCKIPLNWKCLNLLLEALNTWDCKEGANNYITLKQYRAILFQTENLERL